MRRSPHRRPHLDEAAAIAVEAEGFLIAHGHREAAHREARALCEKLPWLTTAQAEDLTRHYVHHRMALSRHMLTTTAGRAQEIREEYETRYQQLRRVLLKRHAAWASTLMACLIGISSAVGVLSR
ncbi:hypothetical protein [Streptomyces sp. NPDC018059]|uniref:hypothetical protein n=1 Tax=Streptomyces sp. NPDC018059 TaxID=3365041 RepID=UPI00379BA723